VLTGRLLLCLSRHQGNKATKVSHVSVFTDFFDVVRYAEGAREPIGGESFRPRGVV
jgi:hypothetical protein